MRFVIFEAGDESNAKCLNDMHEAKEYAKQKAFDNPSCPIEVYQRVAVFVGQVKVEESEG